MHGGKHNYLFSQEVMNQKGSTCYTDLNTGKLADHQKSGSLIGGSLAGKAVSVNSLI